MQEERMGLYRNACIAALFALQNGAHFVGLNASVSHHKQGAHERANHTSEEAVGGNRKAISVGNGARHPLRLGERAEVVLGIGVQFAERGKVVPA